MKNSVAISIALVAVVGIALLGARWLLPAQEATLLAGSDAPQIALKPAAPAPKAAEETPATEPTSVAAPPKAAPSAAPHPQASGKETDAGTRALAKSPSAPARAKAPAATEGFEPGPGRSAPPPKASKPVVTPKKSATPKAQARPKVKKRRRAPQRSAPKRTNGVNATAYHAKALSYHRSGRLAEAAALYTKVLAMAPGHAQAGFNLANIYIQRGSYNQARALLEPLAQASLRPRGVLLNLAITAMGMGNPARALVALEQAEAQSDAAIWEIRFHRAVALAKLGRFDEALVYYQQTAGERPDDPRVRFNLAATCDALGHYARALTHYEAALAIPGNGLAANREAIIDRMHTLRRYLAAGPSPDQE